MTATDVLTGLPGEALVREGLDDIEAGRRTIAALVASVARPRLERIGLIRPDAITVEHAELELYRLLRRHGGDAYGRYNALLRELTSFEQALDRRIRRSAS